jgi:hypothetical protein
MVIVVEPSTASASIDKPSPPCSANAIGIAATSIKLAKIVSVCLELITGITTKFVAYKQSDS